LKMMLCSPLVLILIWGVLFMNRLARVDHGKPDEREF
jgi:hypothetical protein